MRALTLVLLLLATCASAFERVPQRLLNELAPPALDGDGCARSTDEIHKDIVDGKLVSCGAQANGQRSGYLVEETNGGFVMYGWYRDDEWIGTWLALTTVGVWRRYATGVEHGVSYGLEKDGQLAWKQIHIHGRRVFNCEGWEWPC
ncbi:hypothetical protein [Ectopseudomonas khazarica]|uniref:hypothetical protein n=1 Tax=Ectopseudomonas khazarica TaxID=2502979 RepID=UPI00106E4C2D|nr:hypothetical protein [Pseudomonas khazarica]